MKNQTQPERKSDIWSWWLLIVVPLVGIVVVNSPPNLRFILDKFSNQSPENLDANYRYHFSESLRNNPNQKEAIQQEIAFYQQRLAVDSRSGLNRAALAGSYLKMAFIGRTGGSKVDRRFAF
jgi:hypothetical protein